MLPQFPLISVGVLQKCKRIIINAVFPRLRNINIKIPNILGKLEDGETRNIQCSEVHSGRFLSIYLDHNGILSLCEVQVFGCKWSLRNKIHFCLIKGTKFEVIFNVIWPSASSVDDRFHSFPFWKSTMMFILQTPWVHPPGYSKAKRKIQK